MKSTQNNKRGGKPAKAKKKTAKKADKKIPALDTSLEGTLAVEAHHMRVLLREITTHFTNELESEIVRTIQMASDIVAEGKKKDQIQAIVNEMQSLDVKPQKGRLGDLRRIRDLVRKANDQLEGML